MLLLKHPSTTMLPSLLPRRRDIAHHVRTRIAARRGTILARVLLGLVIFALVYLGTAETRALDIAPIRRPTASEHYQATMCALAAPML
jgi:hypothetical protein